MSSRDHMLEQSEQMSERWLEELLWPMHLTRESQWQRRDGTLIRVCDMGDDHLLNTIRVLQFKSPIGTIVRFSAMARKAWIKVMTKEVNSRKPRIGNAPKQLTGRLG